jgi:ring-1,2-phenylacetyl-CoA epoxidase subunit PaaE
MARPVFHALRVSDVRRETPDTVSVALEVPDDLAEEFAFSPGQFLTFRVDGPDGSALRRSFSICSGLDDGELRVAVKRLSGGVFGVHANDVLQVGDTLDVLAPLGRFTTTIDPAHRKSYLGIAAGSGITPVMSLLRTVLAREPDSRFTLLYGNRNARSVIFRDELLDLKDTHLDRLDIVHLFSQEQQSVPLFNGRLTAHKIRALGERLLDLASYDEVFICGPEPMTLELREALVDLGLDAAHVHLELFGSHVPPPPAPVVAAGDKVRLDVTLGGTTQTVDAAPGETVLEAAGRTGMDLPFSCKGGVCATCRARLVEGSVDMAVNYALEPWELDAGFVLTCQSRPTSDQVTVDYDAV